MSLFNPCSHACQFPHFTVMILFNLFPSLAFSLSSRIYLYTLAFSSLFFFHVGSHHNNNISVHIHLYQTKHLESCRLLGYPAVIVIASHYSWDLPFNPGNVIGLLSSVQAGLTPPTSTHLAMMQCYHLATNTVS